MLYHYSRCTLNEVALHHDYDPTEFRPQYVIRSKPTHSHDIPLAPSFTGALLACMTSAHGILDVFLSLDAPVHRCLPLMVYSRVFYALVVLSKLAISAQSPHSSVGAMIELESVDLPLYCSRAMEALRKAAGPDTSGMSAAFYLNVAKFTAWYRKSVMGQPQGATQGEIVQPLADMSATNGNFHTPATTSSLSHRSDSVPLVMSDMSRPPMQAQSTDASFGDSMAWTQAEDSWGFPVSAGFPSDMGNVPDLNGFQDSGMLIFGEDAGFHLDGHHQTWLNGV